jgi:hypothetical protein
VPTFSASQNVEIDVYQRLLGLFIVFGAYGGYRVMVGGSGDSYGTPQWPLRGEVETRVFFDHLDSGSQETFIDVSVTPLIGIATS